MNSHTYDYDYIDGNAAAGELSNIFAMDVTVAEGQCAHCGATKRFAEAHLYMQAPGVVARCAVCEHVLLRFVKARQRAFFGLGRKNDWCSELRMGRAARSIATHDS